MKELKYSLDDLVNILSKLSKNIQKFICEILFDLLSQMNTFVLSDIFRIRIGVNFFCYLNSDLF
ncbi:hypothetical protein LEP1GSC126_1614 [Leptospira kirschneri str. 200801774]|nr:hypothetical protein LEP1GSC126_1614 [Leptospira kirschneri str. 200801774]